LFNASIDGIVYTIGLLPMSILKHFNNTLWYFSRPNQPVDGVEWEEICPFLTIPTQDVK
jgi:hypothetical protein